MEPISALLLPGNISPFEETLQQRRAVSKTVPNLTIPRFEPQTYCSRDKCITAQPDGRFSLFKQISLYKMIELEVREVLASKFNVLIAFKNLGLILGFTTTDH